MVLLFIACVVAFNMTVLLLQPGPLAFALWLLLFVSIPHIPLLIRMWQLFAGHLRNLPCKIVIHRKRAYFRALTRGIVGIAESYVDKDWDCDAIDELVEYVYEHRLDRFARRWPLFATLPVSEFRRFRNWFYRTSFGRRFMEKFRRNPEKLLAEKQYNAGNDFFEWVLGSTRSYTCAQWEPGITNLDNAQIAKLESICQRLGLKPGERILDVGCGNAPFIRYAAEHYGVSAVGITTSEEQAKVAREFCEGYPVEIMVTNYKEFADSGERFDVVVSIGMFEAVPLKEFATYAEAVQKLLKPHGRYFHHSIVRLSLGNNAEETDPNPWIDRDIFPGGYLPTRLELEDLCTAMGRYKLPFLCVLNSRFLDGSHYDRTLMAWVGNMMDNWGEISKNPDYDERFLRRWKLWMTACAGSFRAKRYGVMQITFQHILPPSETEADRELCAM